MPLAGATAGKRPAGGGGAQPIVRGPSGLVIDGREVFLANCIWRAAGQLDKAGEPLSADAIAALGWSYFTDRTDGADLADGKWTERHALHKARGTVRRLRNGAVKLRQVEGVLPTYPDRAKPVHEARQAVDEAIEKHLEAGDAFHTAEDPEAEPPVHAIKVTTGVGKTRAVAKAIAERRKARGKGRPYLVAVPHHRLSDELAADFGQHGITARVFRGRSAPDPDRSGKAMCDDLDAVQIALDLGATVETACCRSKDPKTKIERRCAFYSSCAYQRQKTERPDVWIVAHQLLFTAQRAIGEVEGVIIDEGFWQAGVWTATRGLTLDEIEAQLPFGRAGLDDVVNDLEALRTKLARALRGQESLGGVARRYLVAEGLTTDDCTKAIALEWRLKERTPIYPGMPAKARREAAKAAKGAKHIRAYDRTWRTVRDLLRQDNPDAVSGRLTLAESETEHGVARVVRTQGARPIAAQWRAPTLLMDATLPAPDILKAFFGFDSSSWLNISRSARGYASCDVTH